MAGLFAFFYGTLHFLTYVIADRFASLDFPNGIVAWTTVSNLAKSVGEDIYKRPYITVGFTALMTMVPLAATSTAGMIRRLGGRRWNRLHRLVYATGVLAVIHYWWLVKSDISRPLAYGVVVGLHRPCAVEWWQVEAGTAPLSQSPSRAPRSAARRHAMHSDARHQRDDRVRHAGRRWWRGCRVERNGDRVRAASRR
jgi:hypothetical protein